VISESVFYAIYWTRLILMMSGSFLKFSMGIFLNITKIFYPDYLNYISLIIASICLWGILYSLKKMWKKSREFKEKEINLQKYKAYLVLVEETDRLKMVGRYYFVVNLGL
jgi:hypothetical protein